MSLLKLQCPICDSDDIQHVHGTNTASCNTCKYVWTLRSALSPNWVIGEVSPTQDPGTDIPMTFKEWLVAAGVEPNGNDPRVSLARLAWDAGHAAAWTAAHGAMRVR